MYLYLFTSSFLYTQRLQTVSQPSCDYEAANIHQGMLGREIKETWVFDIIKATTLFSAVLWEKIKSSIDSSHCFQFFIMNS